MKVFDDDLPSHDIDFTDYLPGLKKTGFDPDRIRDSLKTNLRLRSIVAGLPQDDKISIQGADLVETGIEAVSNAMTDPGIILSAQEQLGTEAVIRLTERPALLVKNDSFSIPPTRWQRLDSPYRADVERVLPQVGRIDYTDDSGRTMLGTGFVVSDDLIMTNMHVVEYFADPSPDGTSWSIRAGTTPTIDFKAEYEIPQRKVFKVTDVVLGHDRTDRDRMKSLDLALLRVERQSIDPAGVALPKPLVISGSAPSDDGDNDLYLIGYPWTDNENVVPPAVLQSIFNGIVQAKRLQPGEYGAAFDDFYAFSHDCSTLGGNSGSCVIDLQSGRMIGLHFKGLYKKSNYALQTWRLKNVLAPLGVNFA